MLRCFKKVIMGMKTISIIINSNCKCYWKMYKHILTTFSNSYYIINDIGDLILINSIYVAIVFLHVSRFLFTFYGLFEVTKYYYVEIDKESSVLVLVRF